MTRSRGNLILKPQNLLLLIFAIWAFAFPGAAPRAENPNSEERPYLILISLDGFRWDYPDRYPTPALDQLAARGVRAKALRPVFPTLTFPNHYTIATGLYPARHGLVANRFRDSETGEWFVHKQKDTAQDGHWYSGEPIWVAAEKAGLGAAAYFYVGTEADIQGIRPRYWYSYNKKVDGMKRVRQVLKWLNLDAEDRPHLITLYFEDVDDYSHWYGPDSEENAAAVARVDSYLEALMAGVDNLPFADQVSIVVVSDHGQSSYQPDSKLLVLDELLDLSGTTSVDGGPYVFIYLDQAEPQRAAVIRDGINAVWNCGRAYLPEDSPAEWHVAGNSDFADVLVVAEPGCAVVSSLSSNTLLTPGDHGWAPETADMQGIFIAAGPGLPKGVEVGTLRSVDLYPLLMRLLGLEPSPNVDSQPSELLNLLH